MTILLATILLLLQTSGFTQTTGPKMTVGGWIFMSAAWLFIIWLTYWTFAKILRGSRKR